ncbi:MAG: peptide-methionine (S)-S-oxide reductase MsrA [Candidatus Marinimicrobia bacterium]|nr:peptide-methionine (S)-S-oxide reductase MsrA [Candidatus Neomarinimicrobiota bacterium]
MANDTENKKAVFAAGCFWGVESTFQQMEGVKTTTVGYIGGKVKNPSYELVCTGLTGHAEAVEVEYNPQVVSYETLLDTFFKLHDPTTMNRQGPDVGTQYRSAAYFSNNEEKKIIENKIDALNESGKFSSKVVTEIEAISEFYDAEDYHQDYYKKRGIDGCAI